MRRFILENQRALTIIVVYALCAHFLLLVNDLPYWDGWIYHIRIDRGDYAGVMKEWRDNGRPLIGMIYYWLGAHFGTVTGYRVLDVIAIILAAMEMYALLLQKTGMGPFNSLMAVLLGISYPSYQVHLASTASTYIFALPFFMGGVLLLANADGLSMSRKQLALRLLANVLLLISYISEAYVVAGIAVPFVLCTLNRKDSKWNIRNLLGYYVKYIDVVLLAPLYMAAMWYLMPVQGTYSHSRDLSFSLSSLSRDYLAYYTAALDFNILNLTAYKLHRDVNLILWLVLIVLGGTVFKKRYRDPQAHRLLGYALVALIVMGAIAAPFVLAKRTASTYGWDMRHLTPVGFLAGIIMVSAVNYFVANESLRKKVLYGFAILSLLALNKDYVIWQARGAFDHGVMEHMRDHPELKEKADIFLAKDRFFFREIYRPYEWEMMFRQVQGDTAAKWILAYNESLDPASLAKDSGILHLLRNEKNETINHTDCQIIFQPLPSETSLSWRSGLQYLWLKLTAPEQERRLWTKQRVAMFIKSGKYCVTAK